MHLRRAEGLFPVGGSTLAHVTNALGTRRHTLLKLGGEALQARLRQSQSLQPLKAERDIEPGRVGVVLPVDPRGDPGGQATQQQTGLRRVVDTQQQVGPEVRSGSISQNDALDVVQLELNSMRHPEGFQTLSSSSALWR